AVADDAQRAAAHLVRAGGRLVPDAVVQRLVLLGEPAGQGDDLGERELDDRARVGERRVERRDPGLGRVPQADPVGAEPEGAERVLENGALNAATPAWAACRRSIWLVPMQKAPIASSDGALSMTRAVTCVLERIPSSSTPSRAPISSSSSRAPRSVVTSTPAF